MNNKKNNPPNEEIEENSVLTPKEVSDKKKVTKRRIIIQLAAIILFLAICTVVTIYIWPFMNNLGVPEYREAFKNQIRGYGFTGIFIVIGIFVGQALLAVIPSMPVEIAAGVMYGPYVGLLLCLIGSTIGSILVIFLVKLLGRGFVDTMIDYEKISKMKFLSNPSRLGVVIFCIFLMPGLPKDFIAFLIPFTSLKTWKFLLINFFGRIPMTFMAVYLGDSIYTGNKELAFILFAVASLISILGIVFNKKIADFIDSISNKVKKTKTII